MRPRSSRYLPLSGQPRSFLHLHPHRTVGGDNRPGIRRHRYLSLLAPRRRKERTGHWRPGIQQQKLQDRPHAGRRDLHRRGHHLRRRADRQLHANRKRAGNSPAPATSYACAYPNGDTAANTNAHPCTDVNARFGGTHQHPCANGNRNRRAGIHACPGIRRRVQLPGTGTRRWARRLSVCSYWRLRWV